MFAEPAVIRIRGMAENLGRKLGGLSGAPKSVMLDAFASSEAASCRALLKARSVAPQAKRSYRLTAGELSLLTRHLSAATCQN